MGQVDWFPDGHEVKAEEMDRWRSLRRFGVGASEVAGIMGFGAYDNQTPVQIYGLKTGDIPSRIADDPQILAGKAFEEGIVNLYPHYSGGDRIVEREVFYRHPNFDEIPLFATLDGIDTNGNGVEIKRIGAYARKQDFEELPRHWYLQAQVQLLCSGLPMIQFALFFEGTGRVDLAHTVQLDPIARWEIESAVSKFWWHHVSPGIPPAVQEPDDARYLPQLKGFAEPPPVDLDYDDLGQARSYFELEARIKELQADLESKRKYIFQRLDGAPSARFPDGSQLYAKAHGKGIRLKFRDSGYPVPA